jgi:hypothetical protein
MIMIQLIYISSTTDELPDFELESILESSVRHNYSHDITGLLIYSNGSFLQVIEGSEKAVDETYERIYRDSRHHNITLISRKPIHERVFPACKMEFRRLSHLDAIGNPDIAPLFMDGFNAKKLGAKEGVALEVLSRFSLA